MRAWIKPLFSVLVAVGLLAAAAPSSRASAGPRKNCCGKTDPAPSVPCAQKICCRAALPASISAPASVLKVVLHFLPAVAHSFAAAAPRPTAAAPDCGPPGRPQATHAGRSPPADLLG